MLTLVRHAAVVVDPRVPPHEWVLSPEGQAAAGALRLRGPAISSSEPKAVETARLAGLEPRLDDRLRVVRRPWSHDYAREVESYLAGDEPSGWEPRAEALERLRGALDGYDGVAVSHGLAISLYLGLSFGEWRALPFPAVLVC
jgi:hypothetical protein